MSPTQRQSESTHGGQPKAQVVGTLIGRSLDNLRWTTLAGLVFAIGFEVYQGVEAVALLGAVVAVAFFAAALQLY